MQSKPLTKAEKAWLTEVQEVLNRCPSKRIAFFTIGDSDVHLHDATREGEISNYLDNEGGEWCTAAENIGANFGGAYLRFPNCVHSTAG